MSNFFFGRFQFITLWIQGTQKKVYFALPKSIYLFYITTLTIYHISHFYILQFISFKIKYNDLFNPQTDFTRRERRERDKKVNKIYYLIFSCYLHYYLFLYDIVAISIVFYSDAASYVYGVLVYFLLHFALPNDNAPMRSS